MTADDTMRWVQALVRLWDRGQRGYTMREVAAEAGMTEIVGGQDTGLLFVPVLG